MAPKKHRKPSQPAPECPVTFEKPVRSPSEWPSPHRDTFENIKELGEFCYENFCASIDIRSREQPWRKHTKRRAKWIAKRTNQLWHQHRNEAGWRYWIENEVLSRFSVEVAWYDRPLAMAWSLNNFLHEN